MEQDPRGDFYVCSGPGSVRLQGEDVEAYIRTRYPKAGEEGEGAGA